jgi:cation transport ATPase
MPMTPCRTEKVDFSKKKKTNKNKNRITKKTNRQEESPEETKKTRKQQKKQKNKTCIFRSFDFFFFCFFFVCFFCFVVLRWFWFSICFFLFALVLFFFIIIMFFCRTLYSLCCWTQNNMPWSTVGLCIHCIHLYTHISGMIIQQRPMGMSKNPPIHDAGTTIAARPTSG